MLVYGVLVVVGNIYGGKLVDKKGLICVLIIIFLVFVVILFVLMFIMGSKFVVVIIVLVWGVFVFGNVFGF